MENIKAFFLIAAVWGGMALIVNAGKIGKPLWEWINEPPIAKTFDDWFEGDDSLRRHTVAKLLEGDPRWWRIKKGASNERPFQELYSFYELYAMENGVNLVANCISEEGNKVEKFYLTRAHYDVFNLVAHECIVKRIPDFCRLLFVPANPEWKRFAKEITDRNRYLYEALNKIGEILGPITEEISSQGLRVYDYTCHNPASIVGNLVPADNQPN